MLFPFQLHLTNCFYLYHRNQTFVNLSIRAISIVIRYIYTYLPINKAPLIKDYTAELSPAAIVTYQDRLSSNWFLFPFYQGAEICPIFVLYFCKVIKTVFRYYNSLAVFRSLFPHDLLCQFSQTCWLASLAIVSSPLVMCVVFSSAFQHTKWTKERNNHIHSSYYQT